MRGLTPFLGGRRLGITDYGSVLLRRIVEIGLPMLPSLTNHGDPDIPVSHPAQ